MRDYPGQTPGVCCGFGEAPRPDGDQDFCPAVFPPSAILEGVGDGFDPWKSVFEGPCCYHHHHHPGHDPGPDETVIELVALLRAQPFSKQRGRRGIRERSDATLLKECGRLVAARRPRAGLMENVPAVPVAFAEALGAAPMKAAA